MPLANHSLKMGFWERLHKQTTYLRIGSMDFLLCQTRQSRNVEPGQFVLENVSIRT